MNYKISCLVFIRNPEGKILLLNRKREPNKGFWSPREANLICLSVESPVECARRETMEETNLLLRDEDIQFFAYVSEKEYFGTGNWLMFLFHSRVTLDKLPNDISEGTFAFFGRDEIDNLKIPPTDHQLVWPLYEQERRWFLGCSSRFFKTRA